MKRWRMRIAGPALLLAASCSPPAPTGQVLAQVGDTAITRRDLEAELRASGLGANADPAVQQQVLGKLVERALLVRHAGRERIDRSPDYLAALRRTRDLLLVSTLSAEMVPARQPGEAQVSDFIAGHPWMFERRAIVTGEAIVPAVDAGVDALAGQGSIDAAARLLASRGIAFRRAAVRIDSALLDDDSAPALLGADDGAVVAIRLNDRPALVRVTGHEASAIAADRAPALARAILRRQNEAAAMRRMVAQERARTIVSYQPGLGPAAE